MCYWYETDSVHPPGIALLSVHMGCVLLGCMPGACVHIQGHVSGHACRMACTCTWSRMVLGAHTKGRVAARAHTMGCAALRAVLARATFGACAILGAYVILGALNPFACMRICVVVPRFWHAWNAQWRHGSVPPAHLTTRPVVSALIRGVHLLGHVPD